MLIQRVSETDGQTEGERNWDRAEDTVRERGRYFLVILVEVVGN